MKRFFLVTSMMTIALFISAQSLQEGSVSESRYADNGDGTFTNPVIWGDYPDVDMIRVGEDYYMICSTFCLTPGIPISHSKDLVNWEIIGYAYDRLIGNNVYDMAGGKTRYNGGSWAPCIRYHKGKFYIFYYDNLGYFVTNVSNRPEGPYKQTLLYCHLYDPSVLFDDDGKVYVVHGQNVIYVTEVSEDFTKVISPAKTVFSSFTGAWEGSHIYKRDDYYYICNTAGGTPGREYILRSKNIYGPYEVRELVNTDANLSGCGLHQGGFIDLHNGDSWFFMFQDRVPAGRVPWLFPIKWEEGWPVLPSFENYGRIAPTQRKPFPKANVLGLPFERGDEFSSDRLDLHWQWSHNPDNSKWSLAERRGYLRLHAMQADSWENARNTLVRRFIGPEMTAVTSLDISALKDGDVAGLCVWNKPYSYIGISKQEGKQYLVWTDNGQNIKKSEINIDKNIYFRVTGDNSSIARFEYSRDEKNWFRYGEDFRMEFSGKTYLGNRFGLYCFHTGDGEKGYADFDYMRFSSPYGAANHFNAFNLIPIEFYDDEHNTRLNRVEQNKLSPDQYLEVTESGAWAQYNNIDFGTGVTDFCINALSSLKDSRVEVRLDAPDGELLATCIIPAGQVGREYREYSAPMKSVMGKRKIVLVFHSDYAQSPKVTEFKFK